MKFTYEGTDYDIDENLSFQDFTGINFTELKGYDFAGKIIYASCFSQENPDTKIFPDDLAGAVFVRCNLTNVSVPIDNLIIDCNQTRYKLQNDLRDWELDDQNKPIKLMNEKYWENAGTYIDPTRIPKTKIVLKKTESLETKLRL